LYFIKTPYIVKLFYPSVIWKVKDNQKNIYVTFDDGPDEKITPEVLDLLDEYNAKATFFCVGEKVKENAPIYHQILEQGHSVGNHSYHHLKGRKTNNKEYLINVNEAKKVIDSSFFRPPYGSFNFRQIQALKKDFKIVLWSVLPGDFDNKISKEKVLERAIKHSGAGSIIVFHDNNKFREKMLFALTGFLEHYKSMGYNFKPLTMDLFN
jgi:peptidoglycan/xylan/chitin deacetylase (PgdA/CDA1 family)